MIENVRSTAIEIRFRDHWVLPIAAAYSGDIAGQQAKATMVIGAARRPGMFRQCFVGPDCTKPFSVNLRGAQADIPAEDVNSRPTTKEREPMIGISLFWV
jgi:hypothetical protein